MKRVLANEKTGTWPIPSTSTRSDSTGHPVVRTLPIRHSEAKRRLPLQARPRLRAGAVLPDDCADLISLEVQVHGGFQGRFDAVHPTLLQCFVRAVVQTFSRHQIAGTGTNHSGAKSAQARDDVDCGSFHLDIQNSQGMELANPGRRFRVKSIIRNRDSAMNTKRFFPAGDLPGGPFQFQGDGSRFHEGR